MQDRKIIDDRKNGIQEADGSIPFSSTKSQGISEYPDRAADDSQTKSRGSIPTCARCRRAVDRFESYFDPITRVWTFVARCHGAKQTVELLERDLAGWTWFAPAVAFGDQPFLPERG